MYSMILVDYNSLPATISYIQQLETVFSNGAVNHIVIVETGTDNHNMQTLTQAFSPCEDLHIPGIDVTVQRFALGSHQIVYCQCSENLGYARGNNFGVQVAHAIWNDPYCIISNNDIVFEKPFDLKIAQDLFDAHPEIGIIGPQVITPAGASQSPHKWTCAYKRLIVFIWLCSIERLVGPDRYKKLRAKYYDDLYHNAPTGPCDWVSGSFFLMRTNAFQKAGMFDPHTFLYAEELILSRRMEAVNHTVWFCNELEVIHKHAQTTKNAFSRLRIFEMDFHAVWYYYKTYTNTPGIVLILAKWNFALYKLLHKIFNRLKPHKL